MCAAKYVPNSHVTAIDISPAALAVARRNAERHGVADRITFVESESIRRTCRPNRDSTTSSAIRRTFRRRKWQQLAADVREHEPHIALHAGERGTDVIAPLIEQAATRLKPGGALLIEISPMIAAEVEQLIRDTAGARTRPNDPRPGRPSRASCKRNVAGTLAAMHGVSRAIR